MEFLKIYDVTEKLIKMTNEGSFMCEAGHILKYFISADVHDYHVFRIIKGTYDENYEGREDEVLTVEHQKIDKYDVLEKIGTNSPVTDRRKRDELLDRKTNNQIYTAVLQLDDDEGMSNWDYKVAEDMEEAINIVTQDGYYKVA